MIDLLLGRSSRPVRDWLAAHPTIAVASRDRSGPYAEAARLGAPKAIQVADRWHLLVNASKALRCAIEQHRTQIRAARHSTPKPTAPGISVVPASVGVNTEADVFICGLHPRRLAGSSGRGAR